MKILNLLSSGGTGGIEILCKNIFFNSKEDNRMCFLFSEGKIYNELKVNNPSKIISLKSCNKNIFKIINKITKYCKTEKIDIIVVHHGGILCNIIYILLKKKNPNIKFVRYMHACFDQYSFGNSDNILKNLIVKFEMQKAIDCSDCIIYISHASKESFNKNFKINIRERIIYNGIENKFFNTNLSIEKKDNCINIIYVGRLVKVKGVDILIKAISKIQNSVYLTIVGDGEERENLEELAVRLNIIKKVNFVGRQSNVIEWLDKSDVFVYPSIWEEGFGISVVEAMARGCIPVVSNKGGLPEIIENNKNGYIYDDSIDDLVGILIKIINMSEKEKINISNNAVEKSKNFSIEITLKNLENEYKKLLCMGEFKSEC